MAETYKPTEGMATAAKRALKWKEEGKPGGTLVGLARANQLKTVNHYRQAQYYACTAFLVATK